MDQDRLVKGDIFRPPFIRGAEDGEYDLHVTATKLCREIEKGQQSRKK